MGALSQADSVLSHSQLITLLHCYKFLYQFFIQTRAGSQPGKLLMGREGIEPTRTVRYRFYRPECLP